MTGKGWLSRSGTNARRTPLAPSIWQPRRTGSQSGVQVTELRFRAKPLKHLAQVSDHRRASLAALRARIQRDPATVATRAAARHPREAGGVLGAGELGWRLPKGRSRQQTRSQTDFTHQPPDSRRVPREARRAGYHHLRARDPPHAPSRSSPARPPSRPARSDSSPVRPATSDPFPAGRRSPGCRSA